MEIYQDFGNDLVLNAAGDLQVADGEVLSNQRIVRRLLANPLDYFWQPTYGAGLGQYIGEPENPQIYNKIKGLIIEQMFLEETVAQTPAPQIELSGLPNELNAKITYTYQPTTQQSVITLSLPIPT